MIIRGNTIGTSIKPEKVLVKSENLTEEEKAIARANIGVVPTLIVKVRHYQNEDFDDVREVSHNSVEIYEHAKAGDSVLLMNQNNEYYTLQRAESYIAIFSKTEAYTIDGVSKVDHEKIVIDSEYNVMEFRDSLVLEKRFDETIGYIDTALDSILKIQNELIGGDGV